MKALVGLLALAATAIPAAAQQVTYTVITPPGTFEQAIGMSRNGEYVVGTGGSNGFKWSAAGGLETGFGFPFEPWGVSNDGTVMTGTYLNASSQNEAGVWTAGGGADPQGSPFPSGCGSDVSHLNGCSEDGTVAVGMAWAGCQTTPTMWTPGGGYVAIAKQDPTSSARCYRVSGDGNTFVGWDQGLPTGQAFTRRACVWTDPNTQVFPLTTPTNPNGYGEVTDVNGDGTVFCGLSGNSAWRKVGASEFQLLEPVPGLGGQYAANGISDDGSVVVGVRLQFPVADAVIWTDATGPMLMRDFLAANGITVGATDVRNCTDVSADGTKICGWGNFGAWVVDLAAVNDPWVDLGGGTSGINGAVTLAATGDLTAGSTLTLDLTQAPASAQLVGWAAFAPVPFAALGGTIHAYPFNVQILPFSDPSGSWSASLPWPAGIPMGTDIFVQFLAQDLSVPAGITVSNGVMATTP